MILDYLYNVSQITSKNINCHEFAQQKNYMNKFSCRFYFKSFDNQLNQNIQKMTSELIRYWENLYGFTIQSLTAKYIHDQCNQNKYFVGTKRLIILRKSPFDKMLEEDNCYLKTNYIQDHHLMRLMFLKSLGSPSKSLEKLRPKGTIQVLSKKLLSKMALEECSGDFCKYEFLAPEKDMLKPQNLEYQGQNTINHNQRVLGSEFGVYFLIYVNSK